MGLGTPRKSGPIPEDDTGIIGNTLKGIGAGAVGTIESAALGAATMLDEEAELKARKKIQSVADKFTPEGGDKDSKAYNVGSGLGSILGTGAATLVGGAVGGLEVQLPQVPPVVLERKSVRRVNVPVPQVPHKNNVTAQ